MAKRHRTEDEILADLAANTKTIEEMASAYERRVELFREARALTPPVTHKRLAEIAGVTEIAVINHLKRSEAKTG